MKNIDTQTQTEPLKNDFIDDKLDDIINRLDGYILSSKTIGNELQMDCEIIKKQNAQIDHQLNYEEVDFEEMEHNNFSCRKFLNISICVLFVLIIILMIMRYIIWIK